MTVDVPVRDAATVIVVRDADTAPSVLMGQRGKSAAFMPEKFVFPGGAVDASDKDLRLADGIGWICRRRLLAHAFDVAPEALAIAAIRELWEETGLRLARAGEWRDAPDAWRNFAAGGYRPDVPALKFFFRAVTPPGRSRRFDARFFLADAARLSGDPETFLGAGDELSQLQWVPVNEARSLNLAFITELVLSELASQLPSIDAPHQVPFVKNDSLKSEVIWLA